MKIKKPYSGYDVDDWQWEFLRRNHRYKKAFRAMQWLIRRLNQQKAVVGQRTWKPFGKSFRFLQIDRGNGWEWVYLGRQDFRKFYLNDLPNPNSTSDQYKKLLKKHKPVREIDFEPGVESWDIWNAQLMQRHELAVLIDTRYTIKEIVSDLNSVLLSERARKRLRIRKYPEYLDVWELRRNKKLTADKIAPKLWPSENATKGGRGRYGDKGALVQRVYDHEKEANKLIENAFPAKQRTSKIQT